MTSHTQGQDLSVSVCRPTGTVLSRGRGTVSYSTDTRVGSKNRLP